MDAVPVLRCLRVESPVSQQAQAAILLIQGLHACSVRVQQRHGRIYELVEARAFPEYPIKSILQAKESLEVSCFKFISRSRRRMQVFL